MESMSKLLKTVKQNVRSLAEVKARKKRCSAKLLAPCCYGRYRNQENWPPKSAFFITMTSLYARGYIWLQLGTQVSAGHISKVMWLWERADSCTRSSWVAEGHYQVLYWHIDHICLAFPREWDVCFLFHALIVRIPYACLFSYPVNVTG